MIPRVKVALLFGFLGDAYSGGEVFVERGGYTGSSHRAEVTALSSKINLPHAINCRALCGANLVTKHPGIEGGRNLRTPPCGTAKSTHHIQTSPDGSGLFSSSLLLPSLALSDTKVYELEIRARLGTAAHFCEVGVLKSRTPRHRRSRGWPSKASPPASHPLKPRIE